MLPNKIAIINAIIVNENEIFRGNIIVENSVIKQVIKNDNKIVNLDNYYVYDAKHEEYVLPGIIDTHVHFREPGLEHKATFESESLAAIAGGVTCIVDMPNTIPPATSLNDIEKKIFIASNKSHTNYSFYIAATNYNVDYLLTLNPQDVFGIKLFLGSSTGNLLIDDKVAIDKIFRNSKLPIVAHCEDENIIKENEARIFSAYKDNVAPVCHQQIRNREACINSTRYAIELAAKYGTWFHILHLTTKEEAEIVEKYKFLKNITSEVTVNHLVFNENDYYRLGNKIKCNPSIKKEEDRLKLIEYLSKCYIDTIVTDHAPHTEEEKMKTYFNCPSGIPSIQYALLNVLELVKMKYFDLKLVVEKMCHNPAKIFKIKNRGFIKEGFYADLVIINPTEKTLVSKDKIFSKCSWSPFEGYEYSYSISLTMVNGIIKFFKGNHVNTSYKGTLIELDR